MAIKKNSGRQSPQVAQVSASLADIKSGAQHAAIELPAGAVVVGGFIHVSQAFNAATTATLKVGDSADDDRYTATAADVKNTGVTALTLTGFETTKKTDIAVTYAETGAAATAGALTLYVQYIVKKRALTNQG